MLGYIKIYTLIAVLVLLGSCTGASRIYSGKVESRNRHADARQESSVDHFGGCRYGVL